MKRNGSYYTTLPSGRVIRSREPFYTDNELPIENIFDDVGKALGGAAKAVGSVVKDVGGAIGDAAKWTAGAILDVIDSPVFKIVFPVKMVIDNPLVRSVGKNIPIFKEALDAEDKAKAILKKIKGGKGVTDKLIKEGKTAVAKANKLSGQAKTALAKLEKENKAKKPVKAVPIKTSVKSKTIITPKTTTKIPAVKAIAKPTAAQSAVKVLAAKQAAISDLTKKAPTLTDVKSLLTNFAPEVQKQVISAIQVVASDKDKQNKLVQSIAASTRPEVTAILKHINKTALQTQATSEHIKRNKINKVNRDTATKLNTLMARLEAIDKKIANGTAKQKAVSMAFGIP